MKYGMTLAMLAALAWPLAAQTAAGAPTPAQSTVPGTPADAGARQGGAVALTVNGVPVSAAEYGQTLRLLGAPPPRSLAPADRRNEAESYLKFTSLVAEAQRQGLQNTPEFQRRLQAREQQILVQMVYEQLRRQANAISPEAVTAYSQQHAGDFVQLHLLRLFVAHDLQRPAAAAKLAERLHARALEGEPFSGLQQELAQAAGAASATEAVDIGWHQPGTLALSPANDAAVFALRPGETSPVLSESTGYFLFHVEGRQPVPEAVARQEIRQEIFKQRLQSQLEALRKALKVEMNNAYFDAPARAPRPRATGRPLQESSPDEP